MTSSLVIDRRAFVVGGAALGAGLSLGLAIPGAPFGALAAEGAPEVNAWVVIRPDDTVVIRIARSEMGQGSLTGLAQLVAEELECDWSKVTTEYPTPGQSAARNRPWGDFATGGSRKVVTIEGLAENGKLNRIQQAWLDLDVPQCGYCQSGMIMAATALLAAKPKPTDAEIDAAMTNICRCGTYQQVREAIHAAATA